MWLQETFEIAVRQNSPHTLRASPLPNEEDARDKQRIILTDSLWNYNGPANWKSVYFH